MIRPVAALLGSLVTLVPLTAAGQRPQPPFFQSIAWSPDGTQLVASGVLESWDNGFELFLIPLDATAPRRLDTGSGESPLFPVFAPDGRRIAFGMRTADGHGIWSVGADGAGLRRLLQAERAGAPSYSPDGSRFAFHATDDSLRQVWIADAGGTDPRQVSPPRGNNWNPQWSPTGDWILYYSDRQGGGAHDTIYVIRPDGTDERQVTGGVFPTWTPDGRILFARREGEDVSLFVVNLDGSGKRRVVERAFYGAASPDGRWIAVVAYDRPDDGPARYRVDLMRPDGTERRTIVH
jgi:TolB protein